MLEGGLFQEVVKMFHCKRYLSFLFTVLFIFSCEKTSLNQIQDDFKTINPSEKLQKSLTQTRDAYGSQKKYIKQTIQSKILDKQFFSKSDWIYVPEGISETELLKIVKKAVDNKIVKNYKRPTRFSEIPGIEKTWLNKKRVEDQNWQNTFRNLHREWQKSFSTLSRSKSDFARRKLLESAVTAMKKNISSLKRQRMKERKSLINELGKIRHSILIWGKAIFGTGVSHELTLSQVKEQINQQSGIISIKDVNGVHIRSLSIVKQNRLVKDQIQSETIGHYRTASIYPEEVSIIDENDDEWVYLFQKIEVYPFAQKTGEFEKNINKKIKITGGSLINLDQIQSFLVKEKIKNEALKDWLKEELINMNEENSEIENEIHLTIKNYKKRENEINQDLQELKRRLKDLNKEFKSLPDKDVLKKMKNTFLKIKSQYKGHHSQRTVIDFRKIYDSPTSTQRLKDVFTTMVLEAWNSYNVNVGDYTEEILVDSGKLESYTEHQLHWKPVKSAFQILYLTRRKAGSQTQYIVNISIYIHLISKDFASCNYEKNNTGNYELKLRNEKILPLEIEEEPINTCINELKFPETLTNRLGMTFVRIPAGRFMMGSPSYEPGRYDNENQYEVILTKDYYLQTTEVTQGQWKAVMGYNPSVFENCGDQCPVESVSWLDVQAFIQKLNHMEQEAVYSLPTEAEWEYAARAGTITAYSFGNDANKLSKYGNFCDYNCTGSWKNSNQNDQYKNTAPVKSYPPNAWGLYDMHGNVWEWVADLYYGSFYDPQGATYRLLRGGAWLNEDKGCRSASRISFKPIYANSRMGFRLSAFICQVDIKKLEILNQKITSPSNHNIIYVTHLSFMDPTSGNSLLQTEAKKLINDAVINGINQAENTNTYIQQKNTGHMINNSAGKVNELVNIMLNPNTNRSEKITNFAKFIIDVMKPADVDVIVTGQYIKKRKTIFVSPLIIVGYEEKIIIKGADFLKEEFICTDPNNQSVKALCMGAHDTISQMVKELLLSL